MTYDPERFGRWFHRLRLAEGLSLQAVVDRSEGRIRWETVVSSIEKGVTKSPRADQLVGLAYGVGIEPLYLLEKAGVIDQRHYGRLENFTALERRALARALGQYVARHEEFQPHLADLLTELQDAEAQEDLRQLRALPASDPSRA